MGKKVKRPVRGIYKSLLGRWLAGVSNITAPWAATEQTPFSQRRYTSYEKYLEHQASKLKKVDLEKYDRKYRQALRERMEDLGHYLAGKSVLCLAARIGTECKAFTDLGAFAVGIDLNPGPQNAYVLPGDFHALQFADASVDIVFTNSLDHAYDLTRILAEIRRVLKPGGQFVTEIVTGRADERSFEPGAYESLSWDHVDDVVAAISAQGFDHQSSCLFDYPWPGKHVRFTMATANSPASGESKAVAALPHV